MKSKRDGNLLFPIWVRGFLALFFAGTQILGLCCSISDEAVRTYLPFLVSGGLCLTILVYLGQNFLFAKVAQCAGRPRASVPAFSSSRCFFAAYAVILAGFAIPFATYYPAVMAYDVIPQLDQIRSSGYTTHHPLIHTLMLAMSLKIGELLPWVSNADRAGLACYTILQMLVVAGAFAYVSVFLRRHGVHRYICRLFVLCVAFYPTHGLLAVSITKDTIYGVLVMLFTVCGWELITRDAEQPMSGRWMAGYLILNVLLLLFRNNSIYAWIVWLIIATPVLCRKYGGRKTKAFHRICVVHAAAAVLYLLLGAGMAAAVHAGNTTYAREALSVPAQQIARAVAYHGGELTAEDTERLSAVWGTAQLPEYVPAIADRSKKDIPNDVEVLKTLAREWFSLGLRYPDEYVKAFLIKNKGMWYLGDTSYLYDIYSYAKGYLQLTYPSDQQEYMDVLAPGYERHQKLQLLQAVYRYFAASPAVWKYFPPLALVMQPAFYCWLLFYYCVCCIGLRRMRMLIPAVYAAALTGTLLLGPCVLVRYLYPVMLSVTVLVLLAAAGIPYKLYRRQ